MACMFRDVSRKERGEDRNLRAVGAVEAAVILAINMIEETSLTST